MGIDYAIAAECGLQQRLGRDGFLGHMALRRARSILGQQVEVEGVGVTTAPTEMRRTIATLGGDTVTTRIHIHAADDAADAEFAGRYCATCPVNVGSNAFGCYGFVPYPILAATEDALMARVPAASPMAAAATRILDIAEVRGEFVSRLRRSGPHFFEDPQPAQICWTLRDGVEVKLTSDVLLEAILFSEGRGPVVLPIAALLLGLVDPAAVAPEAFRAWQQDPRALSQAIDERALCSDDPQLGSVLAFVRRSLFAARMGQALWVDG